MACNVFGTPVTDATLKGMTEYHDKAISAIDRARVAMQMKNAEGKDVEARSYVDKLSAGVRCVFYNATGGPLKLVAVLYYAGGIAESPYPSVIQNGQWACFVHGKENGESISAFVLEAIQDNPARQWVFGWSHTHNSPNTCYGEIRQKGQCYGEIRQKGYYSMNSSNAVLNALRILIQGSKVIHEAQDTGDVIFSSIGKTAYPIFEAIMTRNAAI